MSEEKWTYRTGPENNALVPFFSCDLSSISLFNMQVGYKQILRTRTISFQALIIFPDAKLSLERRTVECSVPRTELGQTDQTDHPKLCVTFIKHFSLAPIPRPLSSQFERKNGKFSNTITDGKTQ